MDYKGYSKTHFLTPARKKLGKAIGRGHWKSVVVNVLKNENGRKFCLEKIGLIIRNELREMCHPSTNSILHSQSLQDLQQFTWNELQNELAVKAPVLLRVLQEATVTKTPKHNQDAIVSMCAAIILKHCYCKMSLVQKILSMVLYAGHSGKQVPI